MGTVPSLVRAPSKFALDGMGRRDEHCAARSCQNNWSLGRSEHQSLLPIYYQVGLQGRSDPVENWPNSRWKKCRESAIEVLGVALIGEHSCSMYLWSLPAVLEVFVVISLDKVSSDRAPEVGLFLKVASDFETRQGGLLEALTDSAWGMEEASARYCNTMEHHHICLELREPAHHGR